MAIPDYQSFFLPVLEFLSDGHEHSISDAYDYIADRFNLTEAEKRKLLPSGKQEVYKNRTGWARTYLKKAGLIDSPSRGLIVITERGNNTLRQNLNKIDNNYLNQFSEFQEFRAVRTEDNEVADYETLTPTETMDKAYQLLRKDLAQELLEKVLNQSPEFFEKAVVELLVAMGYGGNVVEAGKAIGRSGDEGIDGTIKEDKLGLDIIYIQAKRWKPGNIVGRPEIQKFVGALVGQGAKKGIFITTSEFSKAAKEYQPRIDTKVILIDGESMSKLMIDYNVGVTRIAEYEIKRIDSDYFDQE